MTRIISVKTVGSTVQIPGVARAPDEPMECQVVGSLESQTEKLHGFLWKWCKNPPTMAFHRNNDDWAMDLGVFSDKPIHHYHEENSSITPEERTPLRSFTLYEYIHVLQVTSFHDEPKPELPFLYTYRKAQWFPVSPTSRHHLPRFKGVPLPGGAFPGN